GLRSAPGERVYWDNRYRGFESLPLRHVLSGENLRNFRKLKDLHLTNTGGVRLPFLRRLLIRARREATCSRSQRQKGA
ncbi:MAG: hypothetical protein N2Z21_02075, partial [Candidatus Sumerlaeaceae bacterium]|nr:hypothetical protein [Candidatus Sumerlaeaceae bacterium]